MSKLVVKAIKLDSEGVLRVETNINDNLELAKCVDKEKMERCLNLQLYEIHIYQNENLINTLHYKGQIVPFTMEDFHDFMTERIKSKVSKM